MEKFLKFRLLAYLASCQASMMQLFFEDRKLLLAVLFCFLASVKSIRYSNGNFGRNQLIVLFASAARLNLDLKKLKFLGWKNEVLTTADK